MQNSPNQFDRENQVQGKQALNHETNENISF